MEFSVFKSIFQGGPSETFAGWICQWLHGMDQNSKLQTPFFFAVIKREKKMKSENKVIDTAKKWRYFQF